MTGLLKFSNSLFSWSGKMGDGQFKTGNVISSQSKRRGLNVGSKYTAWWNIPRQCNTNWSWRLTNFNNLDINLWLWILNYRCLCRLTIVCICVVNFCAQLYCEIVSYLIKFSTFKFNHMILNFAKYNKTNILNLNSLWNECCNL